MITLTKMSFHVMMERVQLNRPNWSSFDKNSIYEIRHGNAWHELDMHLSRLQKEQLHFMSGFSIVILLPLEIRS